MATWAARNGGISEAERDSNAFLFFQYFFSRGWSIPAIAGMLGNIQVESGVNPGIWENMEEYGGGYGLVQWTPYTKYSGWVESELPGENWENNGDAQCARIQWEMENGEQWGANPSAEEPDPPISFEEFSKSWLPADTLANYFLWYYERPAVTEQPIRGEYALKWYGKLMVYFMIFFSRRKRRTVPYI